MSKKAVFFISDLHFGAGRVNDFHKTFELHQFLDHVEEHGSELVLLGDILELLQSELTEIYIQHHELFSHLFRLAKKIPVTYVIGNHDALVAVDYRPDAPSYFLGSAIIVTPTYTNPALGVYAVHGHAYDLFNRRDDILDLTEGSTPGDRIARVAGWLEKHVHPRLDNALEKIYLDYTKVLHRVLDHTRNYASLVTPAHADYQKLGGTFREYEAGARDILAGPDWRAAVMGHTHEQFIRQLPTGFFVNTGSWVGRDYKKRPPLFARIDEDEIQLVDAETYEIMARSPWTDLPDGIWQGAPA